MVKIKLGDVIDFKNGKSVKKSDGIIPIYGGNGILGYTDKSNFSHTIVVGRVGAYCGSIHVEENSCWVSDNAIAGVPREGQDLTYLYYVLKSLNLNSKQIGSSQPLITQSMLKDMVVDIEIDIEKQKKIANSISIIDQKIQINNQINQELEAMAKTLYDYWFVQFDFPDQNGKPYKSSGGKMVYHPELKREIPEGWGVDSLWNIANFYNGLAMQKYRPDTNEDDCLPVIKIREMMNGFSKDTEKARLDIPTEAVVERGDILFSWSATLEVIIWGKERGALNQHIFKVTSDTYPKTFIYFELKSYLKVFKSIAELRKTTMGHITQDHLKQAKIVVPPIKLISKLDAQLQHIMSQQQILENQNQELTQLRDWLLPMLMNGQVKVE
ncbi:restriction endonuclease subunit S [Streptococcus infantis]|uniref:restriction endonuclease subunit S n=1 Tax=Streptococcus infantis TaxID=68892 RepID=UPI00189BD509|nr:restriction endonuclease subunit S [Streptococcus infantis]